MLVSNGRDPAPAVSIVVPVRNEADNVSPFVAEIKAALTGRGFEIIYVNDGSTDGPKRNCWPDGRAAKSAADPPRKVLRAVGGGAQRRPNARAPIVATLDGDGQNNPAFCRI